MKEGANLNALFSTGTYQSLEVRNWYYLYVFFRDGVSEGQFQMVINKEIAAIQRACRNLEKDYEPGITYFVAQKRHNTRFYPTDNNRLKNGNILPGTIVDTDITHPTVSSFYLASHEGIQGTTKPTYYVKLYDDNN